MPTESDYSPQVDGDKLHLVRGSTLQKLYAMIKAARPRVSGGSGLTALERSEGTFIGTSNPPGGAGGGNPYPGLTVQTIDFCENGVLGKRQVLIGPFMPNDPS